MEVGVLVIEMASPVTLLEVEIPAVALIVVSDVPIELPSAVVVGTHQGILPLDISVWLIPSLDSASLETELEASVVLVVVGVVVPGGPGRPPLSSSTAVDTGKLVMYSVLMLVSVT